MKKSKIRMFIAGLVVVIIGSGMYFVPNISKAGGEEEKGTVEDDVKRGNLERVSSNSGTTAIGVDYEYLDISISPDIFLEVEEVYQKTGAQVATQSAILKVTKNSYDTTKANLEKTLRQAKTALQEAKITYKMDLLTLKSQYTSSISTGEIAADSYENTIENLEWQVKQAKEEYEEAQNIISQYPKIITDNEKEKSKKEKVIDKLNTQLKKVINKEDTASKEYEKAKTVYENAVKKKEEMEMINNYIMSYQNMEQTVPKEDSTNIQNFDKDNEEATLSSPSSDLQALIEKVNRDRKEQETSYEAAQKDYTKKKAALEKRQQAVEEKEAAIETKEKEVEILEKNIKKKQEELADAKKQINSLQVSYEQAVSNREIQSVTAKKELEQNLLTSQGAEVSYEIELAKLEETLDAAKDSYKEAKDILETFKESFRDCIWYAKASGTLYYIGYEEGDSITNMTPILGYYNGNMISVEISVDQSERKSISVGDEVTVRTDSMPRGTKGVISMISNTKNSTSASKVTYGVTISIDNVQGKIGNGESAVVTFASDTLENLGKADK